MPVALVVDWHLVKTVFTAHMRSAMCWFLEARCVGDDEALVVGKETGHVRGRRICRPQSADHL